MKNIIPIGLLIGAAVLIGACAPGASSLPETENLQPERRPGDPVTVKGKLGDGLSVAGSMASGKVVGGRSISTAVSHIASIPVIAGIASYGAAPLTPLAVDGSFTVTLTPQSEESDLLLLVNVSWTTLAEKAAGFASLQSQNGADLVLLPLFSANRDLDFSSVNLTSGMAVSETSLESQGNSFTLSFDQILETAYHDNLFKHVKNLYVNGNAATGELDYGERTRCYHTGYLPNGINQWFPIASWKHTWGFNMRIDAYRPSDHSYADLISGSADLEIIPPRTYSLKDPDPQNTPIVVGPTSPFLVSSLLAAPRSTAFWITPIPDSTAGGYVIEFDCNEDIGNGKWSVNLLKGGTRTEKALFDLQAASPFTPEPEHAFMYYIPSLDVSVTAEGLVTAIDLQWYAWNPVRKQYIQVADLSTFRRLCQSYAATLSHGTWENDGFAGQNLEETVSDSLHILPGKYPWYIGESPPPDGVRVSWLVVVYSIAGVEYFFTLFPNMANVI